MSSRVCKQKFIVTAIAIAVMPALTLATEPADLTAIDDRATADLIEINDDFLALARSKLMAFRDYQSSHNFEEIELVEHIGKRGSVSKRKIKEYVVNGTPYGAERILVRENGKIVKKSRVKSKPKSAADYAESQAKFRREISEILDLVEFQPAVREKIDGRWTLRMVFTPRKHARHKSRAGKMIKNVNGTIWFNEQDQELVRLEAQVADTVRYGGGFLANVSEGSRLVYERSRNATGEWLPSRMEAFVRARVLLFKSYHRRITTTYRNFYCSELAAAGVQASP